MCGIAGMWFPKSVEKTKINPAAILALMTAGQQHRGHEGAGIITALHGERREFREHRGIGLVFDIITPDIVKENYGHCGISHNRYSTTGKPKLSNIQPFSVLLNDGSDTECAALAHNGNLTSNLTGLRPTDSDTWHILNKFGQLNHDRATLQIYQSLKDIKGAFSLLFLLKDKDGNNSLIAVRDPKGIRPLWIARFRFKGEIAYLAASETCAFDKIVGAELWRSVKPGEVVIINDSGVKFFRPKKWRQENKFCIFEEIYFMNPQSIMELASVYPQTEHRYAWEFQEALGNQLAEEQQVFLKGDFITPVPDSSKFHTLGCSRKSGMTLEFAILRNHWVGRTFILPVRIIKSMNGGNVLENIEKINRKFTFLTAKFQRAKECVICDDSLVRGRTFKRIIGRVRLINKDLKIRVAIASPPIKYPCFYGIATPTKGELAWNNYDGEEGIKTMLGLDGLRYLSLDGLLKVAESLTGYAPDNWCTACFTGKYPVPIEREEQRRELE